MLADWYFCSALTTPPASSQAFLDLLDVLDFPDSPADLVQLAIGELGRCEPWMRVYATPRLLTAVRRRPDGGHTAQLALRCLSELAGSLPSSFERPVRNAAAALLDPRPGRDRDEALTTLARLCRGTTSIRPTTQPYRDLPDFSPQALLLAFLLELIDNGDGIRALLDDDDEGALAELLPAAERGSYGRLPMLLAVQLAGRLDGSRRRNELVAALWRGPTRIGWLEPDLLAGTAWLLFGIDPVATAEPIELEAITGNRLRALRALPSEAVGAREAAVLELLGQADGPATTLSGVLWQATLWDLAARLHPADTAARLARWWRAPDTADQPIDRPGGPVDDLRPWTSELSGLLRLRRTDPEPLFTEYRRRLEFSPDQAALLFSPWLSRKDDTPRPGAYPAADGPGALRLLAAVPVAVRLLRQASVSKREHLLELVVHAKDVFTVSPLSAVRFDYAGRRPDAEPALPAPTVTLAKWVCFLVERAGRGTLPEIEPGPFVDLVLARRRRDRTTQVQQRYLLHQRASGLALVGWLKEVLTSVTRASDPDPHSRWLDGHPSPAQKLLTSVLGRVGRGRSYTAMDARNAAVLARLRLPEVAFDTGHWSLHGGRAAIWQSYLLTGVPSLPDGDAVFDQLDGAGLVKRLAGLTECVAALLRCDADESEKRVPRWTEAWLATLIAVTEPIDFPQQLQARLVHLLELAELSGHEWQLRVLEQVIDALVEFGIGKPAELTSVFAALGRGGEPAELRTALRSRFLQVVYEARGGSDRRHRGGARSPWLVARDRTTAALFDGSLRALLLRLHGDHGALPNRRSPREVARAGWRHRVLSPAVTSGPADIGGRLDRTVAGAVVGITVDPARDEIRVHRAAATEPGDGVTDLFIANTQASEGFRSGLERTGAGAVGIVCSVEPTSSGLWVNCGLGDPIPVPAKYLRRLRTEVLPIKLGDVLAVPLQRNRTLTAGCEVAGQLDRLPSSLADTGAEVREAILERVEEQADLRLWIEDQEIPLTADPNRWSADALNRWDPDLSRRHLIGSPIPRATPVRRHGGRWLPVDRSLTELIADGVQDGHPDGVVVLVGRVGGAGWRLATRPGECYVVADGEWAAGDAARLAAEVDRVGEDPAGLLVAVGLGFDDAGAVRLRLLPAPPPHAHDRWPELVTDGPFDDRNIRWREAGNHEVLFAEADGTGWWHDTGIPGFPRIRMEGGLPPGEVGDGVPIVPQRWDWRDQRTATARASVQKKDRRLTIPSGEDRRGVLARLFRIDPGDRLSLELIFQPRDGYDAREARTPDGVLVLVTAESVDPLDQLPSESLHFRSGRPAEAIGVRAWPAPLDTFDAVTGEALLAAVEPADRPAAAQALRGRQLRGLVAGSPNTPGKSLAVQTYQLWLEFGDRVVELPLTVDGRRTRRPLPIGSPVTARLTDEGHWRFTATIRTIVVQALWVLTEEQPNRGRKRPAAFPVTVGGSRQRAVPNVRRGTLTVRPAEQARHEPPSRTVEVTRSSCGPIAVRRDGAERRPLRVVVDDGTTRRSGQTARHWDGADRVRLDAEHWLLDDVGAGCYALAREFLFARPDHGELAVDRREERRRELLEGYLARPVPITATRGERGFVLQGLEVRAGTGWTSRVLAAEDEPAWVPGNQYDPKNARVLVHGAADGYAASCLDVDPRNLEQLAKEEGLVAGQRGARTITRHFFFAGPDQSAGPTVRFEWGYGQTLVVALDRILIDQVPLRRLDELPMFFGDHVTQIRLRRAPGTGEVRLELRREDIRFSEETELSRQAKAGIVVFVEVTIDPRSETVQVHGAWSRPPRLTRAPGHAGLADGLVRYRTRRALLDDDSRRHVLELVGAAGGRTVESTRVLAVLDHETYDRSGGRQVVFRYRRLSADPLVAHPLVEGDLLFVSGGRIRRGHNDVHLVFAAAGPDIAAWNHAGDLGEVVVSRRRFSVREAVLRRHAARGEDALARRTFLVRLIERRTDRPGQTGPVSWNGEITNPPTRDVRSLLGLLHADAVFATVAHRDSDRLTLEIDAGTEVTVPWSRLTSGLVERGAVVRLAAEGRNRVSLTPAVRGDRAFAVDGRPAVALPMNRLRNLGNPAGLDIPCLVVAGLPDVQARPGEARRGRGDEPALREIMSGPHPKLVQLQLRDGAVAARPLESTDRAIRVEVDDEKLTAYRGAVAGEDLSPAELAGLSFADGTARQVLARIRATTWYYSDTQSYTWPGGEPRPTEVVDVGPADPTGQPLFCGAHGNLRYADTEMRELAFPTGELFDWALTSGHRRVDAIVAGVLRDRDDTALGLWLERAPGRVVEVLGNLMVLRRAAGVTVARPVPLGNLHWAGFAPGDRLRLRVVDAESDHPALEFEAWEPGPRGGFGAHRTLLRVADTDPADGALQLGTGDWTLTYPLGPAEVEANPAGSVRWLNGDNTISHPDELPGPGRDDVALLVPGDGPDPLRVDGLPDRVAVDDRPAGWVGSGWLAEALRDPQRARTVLGMCGSALPVTVESCLDGTVTISRRHQPTGLLPAGSTAQTRVLGLLGDQVLLRSGAALLAVPVDDLFPGLPAGMRPQLAAAAIRHATVLWVHTDADGRIRCGLPDTDAGGSAREVEVQPELVLGDDVLGCGVLCRRTDTLGLAWLPAATAGWAPMDRERLLRHLVEPKRRQTARLSTEGVLSLVDAAAAGERFDALAVGDTLRVELVGEPEPIAAGRYRYLARAYLTGVLLEYESDDGNHRVSPGPVLAEVARRRSTPHPALVVVGPGERLVSVDLPGWMLAAAPERERLVHHFAAYEQAYRTGADVRDVGGLDPSDVELVRAAGAARHDPVALAELDRALLSWLDRHGPDAFGLRGNRALDLFPFLVAILALDRRRAQDPAAGSASVELTRQLGLRAARSRHLEPVLRSWLLATPDTARQHLWHRLAALPWAPALSPDDLNRYVELASGLAIRAQAAGYSTLRTVAVGLLAAVGRLDRYDELAAHDGYLGILVRLGAGLRDTPGGVAQPVLLDRQREILNDVFQELRDSHGVMTLLPTQLDTAGTAARSLLADLLQDSDRAERATPV